MNAASRCWVRTFSCQICLKISILFLLWSPPQVAVGWATSVGSEFQVNAHGFDPLGGFRAIALEGGSYLVVWQAAEELPPPFGYTVKGIFGRRFDASGRQLGTEFRLNEDSCGSPRSPVVAATPDGGFVAAWLAGVDLRARSFDGVGSPRGAGFQVATESPDTYYDPHFASITASESGDFTVVWSNC